MEDVVVVKLCPWRRCNAPPASAETVYCPWHERIAGAAPGGFSCMWDRCNRKTGAADQLYCQEHARELEKPEHQRPVSSDLARHEDDRDRAVRDEREADRDALEWEDGEPEDEPDVEPEDEDVESIEGEENEERP